ncbi:MAG: hypothetical protein ABDH63_06510 [Candidatus Caldarchaeales archaeon]
MSSKGVSELRAELLRLVATRGHESPEARSKARELAELVTSSESRRPQAASHSFSWVSPGAHHGRVVRVVAVRAGRSRGEPSYFISGEELVRAARTLALKPVDVDHLLFPTPIALLFPEVADAYAGKWGIDVTRWAGTVLDAEAEDDRLEAVVALEEPRVHALALSGAFRGASVVEWARSESCRATDSGTVCERRGVHFSALSLCLELEPAFEGTGVEPLSSESQGALGPAVFSLTGLAGLHPPSAAIASRPDPPEPCDHSEFLRALEFEVPRQVPAYFLREVARRLEREVGSCGHSYVLGLLPAPEGPRVSGARLAAALRLLRDHLSKSPRSNSSGAKEVSCRACT